MWSSFIEGESYFICTSTRYFVGRVVSKTQTDLLLEDAAWIVDTGRFHDFLKNGEPIECEPFIDPIIVPCHMVIDATKWRHKLPLEQK